jgi:ribose transport system substrate-binding protein
MPQVAKAAVSAGVGWIVMNSSVDYLSQLRQHSMVPIFSLLADNEQVGRIQGQQIEAILGESGYVLSIEGPSVGDVAKMRTKGMLSSKPAGVTVKNLKGNWTQQSGYQAMKSWLALSTSREMHIGMVACQNDDMANGARRAFEELDNLTERDAWLKLPITGCDGVAKAGQTWVKQGRLAATVLTPPLAGEAIQMLVSAQRTNTQPNERTVLAPSSFPPLAELKRARATSAGKPS